MERKQTSDEHLDTGPLAPKGQPVSAGEKREKHLETRIKLFGSVGPSVGGSPADTSEADISRFASRPGSSVKTSVRPSVARKVSSQLSEIRSVVSEQRDSQSSSRTQEDGLLERSPSTLTSSSRATVRRLSMSLGEEEEMKDLLTASPKSHEKDVKKKRRSRGGEHKKESLTRGRGRKPKYISSSADELDSSDSIASVSQLIGGLERVRKLREERRKSGRRRRRTKESAADEETASDVTADSVAEDVVSSTASTLTLTEVEEEEEEEEDVRKVSLTELVKEQRQTRRRQNITEVDTEEEQIRQMLKKQRQIRKMYLTEIEKEEEEKRKKSAETDLVDEEEIKKKSTAMKPRKLTRKITDEMIHEKASGMKLQEKRRVTKTLPEPVKVGKKKRKGSDASLKVAATDEETQKLGDEPTMKTRLSIEGTRSPSGETSSEGSAESGEDEMESEEWEDIYEEYDAEGQPSPTGRVAGVDAKRARRRSVERKRKYKRASIVRADIEDKEPKSEIESIRTLDSDQKRKGKRRTGKHRAKSEEDDEAEQRQKTSELFEGAPWERGMQMMAGKKGKKGKFKPKRFTSVSTEGGEDVSEDEQEDEKADLTSKYDSSLTGGKKSKKGKLKRRKFASFTTEEGEEVSEDQEDTRRTSRSRRGSRSLSREPSSETQSRTRGSISSAKSTGKKWKQAARFRKRSFRSSISESRRASDQVSELLISDYAEVDTSLRSSEIELMEDSTGTPYVFPFTPVECEWFLADSNTLVCRHPVLGDIRSRPQSFNFHTLSESLRQRLSSCSP